MTEPSPRLCECGCGTPAPIAARTITKKGHVKGQPIRFVQWHQPVKDRAGYSAVHNFLRRNFPKTSVCDECGSAALTDYALIHGRKYSRDRADYRELCEPCHMSYDNGGERNVNAKLTDAIVLAVRQRHARGEAITALAREYGIARQTVWRAATGRSWRHLDRPYLAQASWRACHAARSAALAASYRATMASYSLWL